VDATESEEGRVDVKQNFAQTEVSARSFANSESEHATEYVLSFTPNFCAVLDRRVVLSRISLASDLPLSMSQIDTDPSIIVAESFEG